MADFPKRVSVRGIEMTIDSWDELDQIVERYGTTSVIGAPDHSRQTETVRASSLTHPDRALLDSFVEQGDRGLLNKDLGPAIGAQGKGIKPALDRWARRIGLVSEEGVSAFEPVNLGVLGRGYRMTEHYLRVARSITGRSSQ